MRRRFSTALDLAGFAAITAGCFTISVAFGLIVGGVALLLASSVIDNGRRK